MWATWPHGKRMPNSGVQHIRNTARAKPRRNITMVWPKQCVWQLLVQQRPVRQLRHTTNSATATIGFASTTHWQPNAINPPCGNTGPAGSEWTQGCNNNNANTSTTRKRHRGRDHDRQWCRNTRLPNMVCARLTIVSTTRRTRSTTENSSRWGYPSAWLQMGFHAQH